MIRKDVIFAVLTTFCLCALMFTVIPIRSGQPYDPWADIDENGQINMYDIAYAAQRFNTAGDPTKNVSITRHASELVTAAYNVSLGAYQVWTSSYIPVDGYSKVSINIISGNNMMVYYLMSCSAPGQIFVADHEYSPWFSNSLVKSYDVMNKYIYIQINSNTSSSTFLFVDVYLVA